MRPEPVDDFSSALCGLNMNAPNIKESGSDLISALKALTPMFDNDSRLLDVYKNEISAVLLALEKSESKTVENAPELPTIKEVMESPCASYWLKDALKSALNRDCLDALRDAELLAGLLARCARS